MESVWEIAQEMWGVVSPHVPFFIYTLFFAFMGQIAKRFVWTDKRVESWARTRDRLWNAGGAKRIPAFFLKVTLAIPLPVHPVATAMILGLFPGIWISEGLESTFWIREGYVVFAALLSLGVYDLSHALLKKRGLDFKFPGEASNPPPAPDSDSTPIPVAKEDEERGGP